MRILHVAEAFGGGVYHIVRVLAERSARAHEVGIAYGVRPETPREARDEIDSSVELFRMPWTDRSVAAQVRGPRKLRRLVQEWRPDVVHLHSSFAGAAGALVVPRDVPTVYTPQAYSFTMREEQDRVRRLAFWLVEAFASRRASVVGAASQSEARLAREQAGARRIEVVANGIPELDEDRLAERDAPAQSRVIALGRTVPQRRPEACARILAAVADLGKVGWIGGGGGDRGTAGFAALVCAGIEPTGWLPRESVMRELESAAAYLHWTAWDGLPLSVLEAMAADAVVVASDIGPNREVLGPRQVCSTEEQAALLLRRILVEPELRRELLASQHRRRRHYGAARMTREWLALYARLAGA